MEKEFKLEKEVEEDNICEWCNANWSKDEKCNEITHYINR